MFSLLKQNFSLNTELIDQENSLFETDNSISVFIGSKYMNGSDLAMFFILMKKTIPQTGV